MYDLIIIGAGPAGMTAGIYGARREMKTLIIGAQLGGQLMWAAEIENIPGFKKIINTDYIARMHDQVKSLNVEIKSEEVKAINKTKDAFEIITNAGKYKAKTVVAAMGLKPRRLAIPGEEEFMGRGVSYCANCDGPFFKNKIVAVVGGGNSALDAAEVLSKIGKQVYLIHRRGEFRGFEVLVEEVKQRKNIKLILNSRLKAIEGGNKVNNIKIETQGDDKTRSIKVDGVFIEVGRIASTDLFIDLAERDRQAQIIVDEKCRTKTPGLFAAGDVTNTPFKQITIASGQATIAVLAAYEYLQLKQGKQIESFFDRGHKA
ncbi:MAG: FAD-dependent oxidoreductase [Patescibacteria group bacterium]|nr:FAD-dependent oxidoreductase [Patescibacteria group bacterium]